MSSKADGGVYEKKSDIARKRIKFAQEEPVSGRLPQAPELN